MKKDYCFGTDSIDGCGSVRDACSAPEAAASEAPSRGCFRRTVYRRVRSAEATRGRRAAGGLVDIRSRKRVSSC